MLLRVRGTITVQPSFDTALESITHFFARLKAEPPAGSLPPPLHQLEPPSSSAQPQSKAQKRGKTASTTSPTDGLVTASQPTLMSAWAHPSSGSNRQQPQMQSSSKRQQWQAAMSAAASAAAAGRLGQGVPAAAPGALVLPVGLSAAIVPAAGPIQPAASSAMLGTGAYAGDALQQQSAPSTAPGLQQNGHMSFSGASPAGQRHHQLPGQTPDACPQSGSLPGSLPGPQGLLHQPQTPHAPQCAFQQQGQQQQLAAGLVQQQGALQAVSNTVQLHEQMQSQQPAAAGMHLNQPVRTSAQQPGDQHGSHAAVAAHHARHQQPQAQQVQRPQRTQQAQHTQHGQHAQQTQQAQPGGACGVTAALLQDWVKVDMQAFVVWVSTHDFMQVSAVTALICKLSCFCFIDTVLKHDLCPACAYCGCLTPLCPSTAAQ